MFVQLFFDVVTDLSGESCPTSFNGRIFTSGFH